jgi:hypothetical protein
MNPDDTRPSVGRGLERRLANVYTLPVRFESHIGLCLLTRMVGSPADEQQVQSVDRRRSAG